MPFNVLRPMTLSELRELGLNRTEQYIYCDFYFRHFLPEILKEHRRYFVEENRGFGEDAFHTMWYLLLLQLKPKTALEIGVYRGQTITLWKLISRLAKFDCSISCVSPFSAAGDSVSSYKNGIDYFEDTKKNHERFNLPMPEVCRCYSIQPEAVEFIQSKQWDLIYIDGNHDYNVVLQDWQVCSRALRQGGVIVLDDSALYTDYRPPRFATAGHPGPSKVADELSKNEFTEIFHTGHNRVFQKL
jgi:SAM-dependent methyltransferase